MLTTIEARLWGLLRSHTALTDAEIAVRAGVPVRPRPREPRTPRQAPRAPAGRDNAINGYVAPAYFPNGRQGGAQT